MSEIAVVHGIKGRLGSAFASRLKRDGYQVIGLDADGEPSGLDEATVPAHMPLLFDCAYQHDDPAGHVERAVGHLSRWRLRRAIFLPSSMWIGTDTPYGRAKLAIEQLAALYRSIGAHVVTDRIGYFPGDGIEPDPREPFFDRLVTGDQLYDRVMNAMLA